MRLKKIILCNIGAYYGTENNEIHLGTSQDKNVVLICGKNGAGKTTLLESIRVVLFGCLNYGYMSETDAYYTKIKSLFNRRAVQENCTKFKIILEYESVENYLTNQYVIHRAWNIIKGGSVKETFHVQKDGRLLDARETDNYQNRLREEIPPRLFELCLFDGEDISRVISDGRVSEYLSEAAKVLFNLDLFSNLDRDLQNFKNLLNLDHDSTTQTKKETLEQLLKDQQSELLVLSEQINELNKEVERTKVAIDVKKRDFELHGGLHKEQRDQIIHHINKLENQRKSHQDQIRNFILNLLPIYLVRDLLNTTEQQMLNEQDVELYNNVKNKLTTDHLTSVIQKLSNHQPVNVDLRYSYELRNELLSMFAPSNDLVIHRASFAQRSEISQFIAILNKTDVQQFIQLYDENAELLEEVQNLRNQLNTNDQSSDFMVLIEEIEYLTQSMEQCKATIVTKQQEELLLAERVKETESALQVEIDKWTQQRKTSNSFAIAEKINNVSARFQAMQIRKKLDQVQSEAIKMVQRLFSKKNYITRIYISHETFDLTLYSDQEIINNQRLSAGEKEMLMLSIIWAMLKCTGWKLPLVFDTLLGRLDQDHKRELIRYFIPNCGDQVIILATDSEIHASHFNELKEHLSCYYTLEFNVVSNLISIQDQHYFDIYDLEVAP
jgi:DNA sulfur modification protein DndD